MILADTSIKRPVFMTMIIVAMLIFGSICYERLGIDLFPNVDLPIITVTCVYRGASPETMETKVVDKIEEEMSALSGIDELRSVSAENISQIYAVFDLEKNIDVAAQDVRDKLAAIRRDLPEAMENPVVEKLDLGAMPIMTLTIAGDIPMPALSRYVKDTVKARIQSIDGVGSIREIGMREREVKIWIDNNRLNARHLTISDVIGAIKSKNVEVPGGKVESDKSEFILKTMGELSDIEDFKSLTIATFNGMPIRLADVAVVEDGMKDEKVVGRLNGKPSIALQIRKQSGKNTVKVASEVKKAIADLRKEAPVGIKMEIPIDTSPFIEESIHSVQFDLLFGAFLATLVILVFLRSFISTIISAVAIPTSIIATFSVMYAMGFTLNNLTTLALSLAVGMLIDDAIVVIENIYRHREMGKTAVQAASDATEEIGLAVMATTFSIVAVFVPVALMSGIVGRMLYQFGITVSVTVLVSLFISFTLTPMLASRFLKKEKNSNFITRGIESFLIFLDNVYKSILRIALNNKFIVVAIAFLSLLAAAYFGSKLGTEFIPKQDKHVFSVNIQTPPGTSLAGTKRAVSEVEEALNPIKKYVKNIFSTIAADPFEDVTKGEITVDLVDKNERPISQAQLMEEAREIVLKIPGLYRCNVNELSDISGGAITNQPVQYTILGSDFNMLASFSARLTNIMRGLSGFVDVDTSYEPGKPELRLILTRDRMENLGVNLLQLANTINLLVSGEQTITQFKDAGKQYDVKVRLSKKFREYPEDISNIFVRTQDGRDVVRVSNVAEVRQDNGQARINRLKRARQITLMSNLKIGKSQGEAMEELRKHAEEIMPQGCRGQFQGMSKEMVRSFQSLTLALYLAIVLIYMLLASQFEHFIHPLTIMLAVPLAAVGAAIALFMMKMNISIFSLIGIIMLMGLVVKNGILLVEFINQCRAKGMDVQEAILTAGPIRMRPILMTSATTIGGMIPVAISSGAGSEMRAPMAIAVIGGMITSTVLTLIVVPVVYSIFNSLLSKFRD